MAEVSVSFGRFHAKRRSQAFPGALQGRAFRFSSNWSSGFSFGRLGPADRKLRKRGEQLKPDETEQLQMNEQTDAQNRTRADFIQFGVIFFGFVLGAAGIIANAIPGALLGVAFMAEGMFYFLFRGSDLD
jgi:hypothetical protein